MMSVTAGGWQCVVRDNARKKNFMTCINLAIKINEKLGGLNTILEESHFKVTLHTPSFL